MIIVINIFQSLELCCPNNNCLSIGTHLIFTMLDKVTNNYDKVLYFQQSSVR